MKQTECRPRPTVQYMYTHSVVEQFAIVCTIELYSKPNCSSTLEKLLPVTRTAGADTGLKKEGAQVVLGRVFKAYLGQVRGLFKEFCKKWVGVRPPPLRIRAWTVSENNLSGKKCIAIVDQPGGCFSTVNEGPGPFYKLRTTLESIFHYTINSKVCGLGPYKIILFEL